MSKRNWVYASQSGGIFDYNFYVTKVVINNTTYTFPERKARISQRTEEKIEYHEDDDIARKALQNWFKKNKTFAQKGEKEEYERS